MAEIIEPTEENVTTPEQPKTPLSRKALILTGAAIGLIIAGGFAMFKNKDTTEESTVEAPLEEGETFIFEDKSFD